MPSRIILFIFKGRFGGIMSDSALDDKVFARGLDITFNLSIHNNRFERNAVLTLIHPQGEIQ
jgi:hypothetical protein